jgi:hypothetical protein
MKYPANTSAPSELCCLPRGSSTGGVSPGLTFGAVVSGSLGDGGNDGAADDAGGVDAGSAEFGA